jgi:NTE family protein
MPRPLYLALSGGGAHAASHAGVVKALEDQGIPVAGLAGVSGGALVAACWAGGGDLDQAVDQASRLHPWMWVRGWGGGLLSGTRLGMMIDEFLPTPTFEGLRVPVVVVATDVDTGEPVVFREGDVREAVRASCSFPGVFPPMVVNGRRLYDGGISEVIPVRRARALAGEGGVVVALALRAGVTLLRGRTRGELAGADLVIAPSMGESGWMRPIKIPSFYAAGQEALREALPELRRLLEG